VLVGSARLVPAVGLLPLAARSAVAAACADPEDSLRASLHYAEAAPDPQKTCGGCGFFTPAAGSDCGNCKIFNGPANAKGHCDSWSAKS
jgi:hypothetical protein